MIEMRTYFTPDSSVWRMLPQRARIAFTRYLEEVSEAAADHLEREIRNEAPGRLGQAFSVRVEDSGSFRYRVIASGPTYPTVWVTQGTPPHAIIARGRALAFEWNGPAGQGMYFFKSVWHPGTKPNPFLERAFQTVKAAVQPIIQRLGSRILHRTFYGN